MSRFIRVLMWPIISLLITGGLHFTLEAIWPDLKETFVPAVLAPLLLAYGAWVGSAMIVAGGSYLKAIVAGAILAVLPIVLDIIGFGVVLGRGTTAGTLAAAFGLGMIMFGTVLGAGFMTSRQAATARATGEVRGTTGAPARSF